MVHVLVVAYGLEVAFHLVVAYGLEVAFGLEVVLHDRLEVVLHG